MKNELLPVYHGNRTFLGLKDLVISIYTQKCPFECFFCGIPSRSADEDVPLEDIIKQIHWVFDQHEGEIESYRQLSVGNEGSILDTKRFPQEAMDYLLRRAREIPDLDVLSLETRPEYINEKILREISGKTHARLIDLTVGFETQDDTLRNVTLNKKMDKKTLESKMRILHKFGARLTSYVMLKPGPHMTEEEGVREARSTIDYLASICDSSKVSLIIYLNPTYVARGTPLAEKARQLGYSPPTIQSVMQVIHHCSDLKIPVYTGLWSENLADEKGDYTGREGYDPILRKAIKEFNRTQDPDAISRYR